MSLSMSLVLVAAVAGLLGTAEGNAFRGSGNIMDKVGRVSKEELKAAVLEEVMAALGSGNRVTEDRLQGIEKTLQPMFLAMPKNVHGNLDHASARYVMHRLFVQRHAMYIKGLEPGGGSWSDGSISAADVLQDRVPDFVQSLFEERLKGRGLGMHELAVLAATLEHLIHDEAVKRLEVSYAAENLGTEAQLSEFDAQALLDTYMMIFIQGRNVSDTTPEQLAREKAGIASSYPGWKATQKFAHQVQSGVAASKSAETDFADGQFTFQGMSAVVEEIGERYGRWQDAECRDLKTDLVKIENHGTGRVLLKDFYGAGLSGSWQFSESMEYLRELGALDESSQQPAVLIPNYVNARSNCLASSSIYSVCCINECEALLGHLEAKIAMPEASATTILDLVSKLPSATVAAPRELPQELSKRLEDVAEHHEGSVPLHGRLFAQWLHHAYPRECPYPHTSGSTNPMTADEWMQDQNRSVSATRAEMQEIVERYQPKVNDASDTETAASGSRSPAPLPWTHHEELIVAKVPQKPANSGWLRNMVFLVAAVSACAAFGNSAMSSLAAVRGSKSSESLLPSYAKKQHAC
eukprot:CAMPEP_0197629402 /NCGR_PEP_ID=MMETSP1338-20131121/7266_1 /TAXON_ID=43686 ORGANISM="Pelagodinium beii, Strain RCC1491" /NCGR_SAMPLE_ID=MMETSP1338 /ASSEMBLY_ACC=CAM_ASM_000754 /LENGTH=579 /DNA_ID=CAMNT_0043200439 /DNA_START=134 /DNA_END=1873 /DNA_ORIENTATION=+